MYSSVNNRQMVYIILIVMTTYDVQSIPYILSRTTGRGGWVSVILTSLVFALIVVFITKLNNMHQGKTLFDYSRDIGGRVFAWIFRGLYLAYYFIIFVYNFTQTNNLIKAEFLDKSPIWATSLAGMVVYGLIAYRGIRNIARMFEVIVPLFLLFFILASVLALSQGLIYNIFPFFEPHRITDYLVSTQNLIVPFSGASALFAIPFTSRNKKAPIWAFFGVIMVGLYYVLLFESCIAVAGINSMMHYKTAVIEAFRLVDFPILDRVDVFYLTVGFSGLFMGISLSYAVLVDYLCRIFSKLSRLVITIIAGCVLYTVSLFLKGLSELNDPFRIVFSVVVVISSIMAPTVLFITAKIKSAVGKNNAG